MPGNEITTNNFSKFGKLSKFSDMRTSQADFHCQWQHLKNSHVRALAWMLTAPVLLDRDCGLWQDKIALPLVADKQALQDWVNALDQNPEGLIDLLHQHPSRRLGLYAETLFEYFLSSHQMLYAHGLQVHNKGKNTVGEFDFLLYADGGLKHLELATKFYLYHKAARMHQPESLSGLYDYLGPNLADSLAAKMQKIVSQQLQLSQHPLAQDLLPQAVVSAQALVLGWLFYRDGDQPGVDTHAEGIANDHCQGFIWTHSELAVMDFQHGLILDRLDWLAPAQVEQGRAHDKAKIISGLHAHFQIANTPVMLALMQENQALMQEYSRGMVVPDSWFADADAVQAKQLAREEIPDMSAS
ncbi:DUF1853 family protein [Undibacterium sp. TJN19]|uniref:DUF1853 family protein n=1 Tax=Undibacterium sp. TJN19 TaxID=3413055 RepID=UPI003BF34B92